METKKVTLLDKITNVIETKIAPPLIRISQVRYLMALQSAFLTLMPYMLIGATATLILNLPGLFSSTNGLNLPQVANFFSVIITPIRTPLLQMVFVTINLLALIIAVLNGYHLAKYYQKEKNDLRIDPLVASLISMISFFSFIDFSTLSENFDWPSYIMGSPSLFGGIVISIVAVELYRFFIQKNITIKMPEGVPPMIAAAFTSIIPVAAIIFFMSLVGRGIAGFDFLTVFGNAMSFLVVGGSGWFAQLVAFVMDRLLWFVGLHGSNIVGSVMSPIWTTMITDNVSAFQAGQAIPFMFTSEWITNYVRLSVFPIALLCALSPVKRFKTLGKLSLPGSVFNIAEPIMYGLPIVLNPLMFVPWVLGFGALFLFSVLLSVVGIAPPMIAMTVWTMPAPIAAFIASGFNVMGFVVSCVNFVILFFIFLPFFKVMERQELKIEAEMEAEAAVEGK